MSHLSVRPSSCPLAMVAGCWIPGCKGPLGQLWKVEQVHVLLLHGHWGEQAAGVQPVLYLLPVPCTYWGPWRLLEGAPSELCWREHFQKGALQDGSTNRGGSTDRRGSWRKWRGER